MNQSRFTLNALLVVVLVFSALIFFFTMFVANLADWSAVNDYYQIEGTDLAILYSDEKTNGLYEGPENTCVLKVEGTFGHDWGVVLEEPFLYVNEYTYTDMGMMHCNLVRIDLGTFEHETLLKDAVLRGRCQSGELVCVSGLLMPSTFPATNSLCRLYGMTTGVAPEQGAAQVLYLDPLTAEVVGSAPCEDVMGDQFEGLYLERSLQDVLGEAAA